jgi:hypothetical protein
LIGQGLFFGANQLTTVAGVQAFDGQPLRPLTTLFLDYGEEAVFTADEETEIIHLGLPDLRGLAQPQQFAPAVAAE